MRTMRSLHRVLLTTALCLAAAGVSADEAERAFYQGKTVRMIVGSGTGGGYDIFSRLIAPYLAKTLGTTVIVENQPGAGGLVALNRLYNAPPDGLQLSLSNGTSASFAQITEQQGARFDLAKFSYLATVGAPPGLWLVGPYSPVKEVQQAVSTKMKWRWGSSGRRPDTPSARPSPARRSSSIAMLCPDTRAARTQEWPSHAVRWTRFTFRNPPPTAS